MQDRFYRPCIVRRRQRQLAMTLKEQIERDIDGVFLEMDDFAEEIVFDGEKMKAVAEELSPSGEAAARQKYEGTFRRSLLLFVRALAKPPIINKRVDIERAGRVGRWTVRKLIEEGGMMRIELEAVDS